MTVTEAQPGAAAIPKFIVDSLVDLVSDEAAGAEPVEVVFKPAHSNDVVAVRYDDGRTLMIKRGRYDWAEEGFRTSWHAAQLLAADSDILAPRPIPIPEGLDEKPLEAYWRIDLPTLSRLWPDLGPRARTGALRSWGNLARRVHAIRVPGNGPLPKAVRGPSSLGSWLQEDIGGRLLPAVHGTWPMAVPAVERLTEMVPLVDERANGDDGRLIHNDLHMGNVLCRRNGEKVECVGLLDLEDAVGCVAEADLASSQVLHGPLFTMGIRGDWSDELLAGYRKKVDPWLLAFFRAYHLTNLGFYSALIGHHEHSVEVGEALHDEVAMLPA